MQINTKLSDFFRSVEVLQVLMKIGIDISHASRFDRIVSKHGERFLRRFLSSEEISLWRKSSAPSRFLASRWCAKEALTKALGTKNAFSGVQIESDGSGPPTFRAVSGEWKKSLPPGVCLSISHDLDVAVAMVVISPKT